MELLALNLGEAQKAPEEGQHYSQLRGEMKRLERSVRAVGAEVRL